MITKCLICQKEFPDSPSSKRKFCSLSCYWKYLLQHPVKYWQGKHLPKYMIEKTRKKLLGKPTWSSIHKEEMSRIMKDKYRQGKGNPNWKGGKIKDSSGYIHLRVFGHPFASKRGSYVLRSHLIAEKILDRYLTGKELIHHINEIRDDDKPENLYLFSNKSIHIGHHHLKNKPELTSNLFL